MYRPAFHIAQGTIPESIDFHGLTTAWRNYPVANLRIHPCELHAWLSNVQQTIIWVDADTIHCALQVPGDDIAQGREKFFQQRPVTGCCRIAMKRMEHPQRRICGVIFWILTAIGEAVWDKPLVCKRRKGFQQT